MSYHVRSMLALAAFALVLPTFSSSVLGQDKGLKKLDWSHAFDFGARKLGETDITKAKRWGVEAFKDNNTGLGLYISQTGCIAAAPNFTGDTPIKPSKGPIWFTGLDLPARKAGMNDWKDATTHCVEIFRDANTDNFLFISSTGNIASTTGKLFPGTMGKSPKWVHSIDLAVRKGGVKEWDKAVKYGIEVYKDGNSGNYIFVTEHGHVAIIPELKEVVGEGKAPQWLHGLDLSCRGSKEKAFTDKTLKFGVEAYHDVSTGNVILISETGSIAVYTAPTNLKAPSTNVKEPVWTHGLNIRCREHGEKDFTETTKAFGAEVFTEPNLGVTIYINEQGTLGAVAK